MRNSLPALPNSSEVIYDTDLFTERKVNKIVFIKKSEKMSTQKPISNALFKV